MKLPRIQKCFANSPVRAHVQAKLEVRRLLEIGGTMGGGKALEIGCGRGEGFRHILDTFGADRVVGVDVDPDQVALARKRIRPRHRDRVEVLCAAAEHLDFPDASFDAAFDFQMLHHADDWQQAVAEVSRLLRPGGRFYLSEICLPALKNPLVRAVFHPDTSSAFDADTLLEACVSAGLENGGRVSRLGPLWVFACLTKAS